MQRITSPTGTIPLAGAAAEPASLTRRMAVIGTTCLCMLQSATPAAAEEEDPNRSRRPQAGDRLVFAMGDELGKEIRPDAVPEGGPQILAWPIDPKTGAVRDGSRLNQILLVRLTEDGLDEATRARSAAGIVAYSAICPHALCPVTEWVTDRQLLHCPCHNSEYDPRKSAMVVNGPAPRALAALPLRILNGALIVAQGFAGRVGAPQT